MSDDDVNLLSHFEILGILKVPSCSMNRRSKMNGQQVRPDSGQVNRISVELQPQLLSFIHTFY